MKVPEDKLQEVADFLGQAAERLRRIAYPVEKPQVAPPSLVEAVRGVIALSQDHRIPVQAGLLRDALERAEIDIAAMREFVRAVEDAKRETFGDDWDRADILGFKWHNEIVRAYRNLPESLKGEKR